MKNKTIIIGKSGYGKSYELLRRASKNKGTTIICNGCCFLSDYVKSFPWLKEFKPKDCHYNFLVEDDAKYFIEKTNSNAYKYSSLEFVISLIRGCDYGYIGDNKSAMVAFDDGSWYSLRNKLQTFWELSHCQCQIIITCENIEDLLDMIPNDGMLKDVKKYWDIVEVKYTKLKPAGIARLVPYKHGEKGQGKC